MVEKSLHEQLSEADLSFLMKLRLASKHGLDYWYARINPPNESPEVFRLFLKLLKEPINPVWVERKSSFGEHALLGETECFKFEAEVMVLGMKKKFFCKGYFYNEHDLKGVTIQSFRKVGRL